MNKNCIILFIKINKEINMNSNFLKLKKENEKDDSLIINDDLFEQKDMESDDDQIILNEQNDGECSFFSDNSENDLNKFKIIANNINLQNSNANINTNEITKNENVININNDNIKNDNLLNNNKIKKNEEINKKNDYINNNEKNEIKNNDIIDEIKINDENNLNKEENNIKNLEHKNIKINNNAKNEQPKTKIINNESKNQNKPKNYFNKKVLYKKHQFNPANNINHENKTSKVLRNNNNEINIISNKKFDKKLLTEKRQKSSRSYINKMKEKKSMKINYNNHDKIWKNSSRNDEGSKSYTATDKNNIVPGTEISFDKYGNKTVIKKRLKNKIKLSDISKTNHKLIKIEKKLNRSYEHNLIKSSSPKINHKKINFTNNINVNKSTGFNIKNRMKNNSKENKTERNTDNLKKVLMHKIDKQINDIIKGKEKMFFNENNKLFFLGFCDILFELGFLHIKETEINDISQIKNHLNELCTQPFTNRKILSENFLFNEQKLLICAWKTILNNFVLIKEFDSLPQELEEITLDDCKLFIYIITGLFIGFNQKNLNENNKIISQKNLKNKSLSNFRKIEGNKDIIHNVKLNQSFTKSSSNKTKSKYHFRKKSDIKDMNNTESNNSNRSSKDNILKNILDNRQKSDYNFKSILKIKNFFSYFSELRKLYNLYKKELKEINKRISTEKDLTFKPKTNRNNKILLDKLSPKMDFFQRNDLLKKRNEKKIITLQRERSQKLLKECTFEPCKSSKKKENINPKEIVNRLYKNINRNSNILHKSANLNLNLSPYLPCEKGEKIFYQTKNQEIFNYAPNINKKFNREMFHNSPLVQDELLNKRIKDLRNANLERLLNNYEKNTRGILSDDIKKDKNLLKQIIEADKGNMKLDMEKRTNKDTFDNFQNFNFYNMPNYNYFFNQRIMQEPLFTVEIKIKQNIKTIEVYQDDIPEKLAYDFCIENTLGTGSYEKIVNIIKSKLDEIYNGNFNEDIINNENIEEEEDINNNSKVNKEKIHEIINQNNNNEINEEKEDINLDMDLNLNNNINSEKENGKNNENINDEYIDNIDEEHNISIEQIKEEIKEEEKINQINDENIIKENNSE